MYVYTYLLIYLRKNMATEFYQWKTTKSDTSYCAQSMQIEYESVLDSHANYLHDITPFIEIMLIRSCDIQRHLSALPHTHIGSQNFALTQSNRFLFFVLSSENNGKKHENSVRHSWTEIAPPTQKQKKFWNWNSPYSVFRVDWLNYGWAIAWGQGNCLRWAWAFILNIYLLITVRSHGEIVSPQA